MTKDTKLSELVINKLTTAQYNAIEEKDPNQLYIVTDGGVSAFDLFDHKWSDHILNDMSWLRSDTFSWQDGTVYTEAYNHLVADIDGISTTTETIGSDTIAYYPCADGHKVVAADQETTAQNIYNESGVAWYYILDSVNQRFKLPRKRSSQIVSSVKNSDGSWYRLYADGWVEQGGITSEITDFELKTVNLPVEMANTNYTNTFGCGWNGTNDDETYIGAYCERIQSRTVNSFVLYSRSSTKKIISWQVCGMSAIDMTPFNADEKYLYFYVGQFSQSATEQTAGLNAELFNNKADVDSVILKENMQVVSELPAAPVEGVYYFVKE